MKMNTNCVVGFCFLRVEQLGLHILLILVRVGKTLQYLYTLMDQSGQWPDSLLASIAKIACCLLVRLNNEFLEY